MKKNNNTHLIEDVCKELGYNDSPGFFDLRKNINYNESTFEKMQWIDLAKKLNATKIMFFNDYPLILFFEMNSSNEENVYELQKKMWNMSKAPLFFVSLPGEIRLYNSYEKPLRDFNTWEKKSTWLERVKNITEITNVLKNYNRQQIETEYFIDEIENDIDKKNRADAWLLKNLKLLRKKLEELGLDRSTSHALIARSVFIRYMEDRDVLIKKYYNIFNKLDEEYNNYFEVLNNKETTYNFFQKLKNDFNGDMFPLGENEKKLVTQEHLILLKDFLEGKRMDDEEELFFWAYQFDVIPTELISNIYEEFYHAKGIDDKGTHYTPSVLVDYVLSESLKAVKTKGKIKILDPACGSGIFLVESFRYLMRNERVITGEWPNYDQMINLLKKCIYGIDVNEEALRIAALSLYLSVLDYMEPSDIRNIKLPKLIYDAKNPEQGGFNLFNYNAFSLTRDEKNEIIQREEEGKYKKNQALLNLECLPLENNSFDLIIGNPPWGQAKGEEGNIAIHWCDSFESPIGDKELSQAFIWRSKKLLKEDGEIALLVSSGIFFKHNKKSVKFREDFLKSSKIRSIINFSQVRHVFFQGHSNNAVSPFAVVIFSNSVLENALKNKLLYISVKKRLLSEKLQAVIINKSDIQLVRQSQFILEDSSWKIFLWGGNADLELISELKMNTSLSEYCFNKDIVKGQGFKAKGPGSPIDFSEFKDIPIIKSNSFTRYQDVKCLSLQETPSEVHRAGVKELYFGRRLLIKRGIAQADKQNGKIIARIVEKPLLFKNSFHGIALDNFTEDEGLVILGILWSSLARYYHFMTCSTWGFWHDEIHLEEHMNLPIIFPKDEKHTKRIVELVKELMIIENEVNLLCDIKFEIKRLESKLDTEIYNLFNLSTEQENLINDFCNYSLDSYYNGYKSKAFAKPYKDEILDYSKELTNFWNDLLKEKNKKVVSSLYYPSNSNLIGMSFELIDINENKEVSISIDEDEWQRWFNILEKSLPERRSENIYLDRQIKIFGDNEFFILKRAEKSQWTKSLAIRDGYELLGELYKQEWKQGVE